MQLKIGARVYQIEKITQQEIQEATGDSGNVCGFTDYYDSRICINSELNKSVREEVLIHEVVHTLLDNSGVEELAKQLKTEPCLSELIATLLGPRLHACCLDNDIKQLLTEI